MKFNLVFHERQLIGFDDDRLVAQHPVAIYVALIVVICRGSPETPRVDGSIYGLAGATVEIWRDKSRNEILTNCCDVKPTSAPVKYM